MGGGKSSIIEYRYQPSSGFILFEIYGVEFEIIYYLTKYIKNKLSCVVQLIRLDE